MRPVALALLSLYKLALSPLIRALGIECRYHPSCSTYSVEAIRRHGAWHGGWLTLARLCRCHPYGGSGLDNVPETLKAAPVWAPWNVGVWRTPNAPEMDSPDADTDLPRRGDTRL